MEDFEQLVKLYTLSTKGRDYLNEKQVLESLKQQYKISEAEVFADLLENYDRLHLTDRCLAYHTPNKCMLYFAQRGNTEGFVIAAARGANNWTACLSALCENKHYKMIPIL